VVLWYQKWTQKGPIPRYYQNDPTLDPKGTKSVRGRIWGHIMVWEGPRWSPRIPGILQRAYKGLPVPTYVVLSTEYSCATPEGGEWELQPPNISEWLEVLTPPVWSHYHSLLHPLVLCTLYSTTKGLRRTRVCMCGCKDVCAYNTPLQHPTYPLDDTTYTWSMSGRMVCTNHHNTLCVHVGIYLLTLGH
jgi:hypothetical protein